jgi:Cytochrome P460
MKHKISLIMTSVLGAIAAIAAPSVLTQDRYKLQIPGGLSFSEFRGYESWEFINVSESKGKVALILGNPAMVNAYRAGLPDNGKLFPDGVKMAKIHWEAKTNTTAPSAPTVGGTLYDVDFMVKDSKRFADSGGWGYGVFKFDAATGNFRPGDLSGTPPQGNDAKCGFACHTIAKARDYVFTEFARR